MNLPDRLFSLLPRRKPRQTCGLMLLWSLPPDKAKVLVDALDAMIEESGPGPGQNTPAPDGGNQYRTDDEYLEIPDFLKE